VIALPKPSGPGSEIMEYFEKATGSRFALAQRKRNSNDLWDPKNFWLNGTAWRSFQREENHRCNICVLAGTRPGAGP
jgi:hypothetical protein